MPRKTRSFILRQNRREPHLLQSPLFPHKTTCHRIRAQRFCGRSFFHEHHFLRGISQIRFIGFMGTSSRFSAGFIQLPFYNGRKSAAFFMETSKKRWVPAGHRQAPWNEYTQFLTICKEGKENYSRFSNVGNSSEKRFSIIARACRQPAEKSARLSWERYPWQEAKTPSTAPISSRSKK